MTDAQRLERLENMQLSTEKNISALASSIKHMKEAYERIEKTQEKVGDTLVKISEAVIKLGHIHDDVNELKKDQKERDKDGSLREQALDKRVGGIEGLVRFVNLKILGAVLAALIALIIK
jgi:hypothetical protein